MVDTTNNDKIKPTYKYTDEDDQLFSDNDERAIFFAKGVVETVKKLNWAPDVIHIHGWMASLLPLYLREFYKEEPLFTESKIVTSLYNTGFEGDLNSDLSSKVKFDLDSNAKIETLQKPNYINILKSAIENSDAVIYGSENIDESLASYIEEKEKPLLEYQEENLKEAYLNFYADLLSVNQ